MAAIWPGPTPDSAMNSGSNSGSEVSETPAIAENAVVAANRASSAPRSERSVRIFSHSERRTGVKERGWLGTTCQASCGCAVNSVSVAVRSR